MIKKLIRKILGVKDQAAARHATEPVVMTADQHGIDPRMVSNNAIRVTQTLQESGFKAFVVGGAVRDLLLGVKPKDFDIATDATPEQVKRLFRRAFIIGRRFQIVHVMFGQDLLEVTTFRGAAQDDAPKDEHGRVLRDNIFGPQHEDAARRDFTINALYFDPSTEEVWDYVGGVTDVRARRMKLIGPPVTRYREDPVRMLRAVRLAAKLGLAIDKKTAEPIPRLAELIKNVPAARLFDEMQKLLLSGHATETLRSLREQGLHHGLLPMIDVILEQPGGQRFIEVALATTDARVREDKGVSPAFLFATLLWHEVLAHWNSAKAKGAKPLPALFDAMDIVLDNPAKQIAIPRRFEATIKEIWALQPRFEQRSGSRPFRLLEHPRFRAAYDFLVLRAEAGEAPQELADWWTQFQAGDQPAREAMLRSDEAPKKRRRSRSRGRKRRDAAEGGTADVSSAPADEAESGDRDGSS
jgi:poly(A) polymerase